MSERLLQIAEEEEQALVRELSLHPAYAKLEAIRALVRLYRSEGVGKSISTSQAIGASEVYQPPARTTSKVSQALVVAKAGEEFLTALGRRAQVAEFMDEFKRRGLEVSHEKPIAYVSSVLSHNHRFNNVRGKGYGLAEWDTADAVADALSPKTPSPQTPSSFQGLVVSPTTGWGAAHAEPESRAQEVGGDAVSKLEDMLK